MKIMGNIGELHDNINKAMDEFDACDDEIIGLYNESDRLRRKAEILDEERRRKLRKAEKEYYTKLSEKIIINVGDEFIVENFRDIRTGDFKQFNNAGYKLKIVGVGKTYGGYVSVFYIKHKGSYSVVFSKVILTKWKLIKLLNTGCESFKRDIKIDKLME